MLNRKPPPDPDATGRMVLTAEDLRARGSCDPYYQLYRRLFPHGQVPTEAVCRRHAHRFEWGWARVHLLTHDERARFDREARSHEHRAPDELPPSPTAAEVDVAAERHRQALIHAREVLVARLVEHERGATPTMEPPFHHLTTYTQDLRAATAAYRRVAQATEAARLDQREADARLFARIWADRPPSELTAAEYALADEERRLRELQATREAQSVATRGPGDRTGTWGQVLGDELLWHQRHEEWQRYVRQPYRPATPTVTPTPPPSPTPPLRWEVTNRVGDPERVRRLLQELNELERRRRR